MITPAYRATILQMKENNVSIREISRTLRLPEILFEMLLKMVPGQAR